jgi:mannose-6-phosphate isomerase
MLCFEPNYHAKPWGGRRLEHFFDRELPPGPIGESWELVAFGGESSRVAQGPLKGETLHRLWQSGSLSQSRTELFPLLLKWLDVHAPLSVQVHPDENAVKKLGHGNPKAEAWFVAHAEPNAFIHIGHHQKLDPTLLLESARDGSIPSWIHKIHPQTGDLIYVQPGVLHAIGEGLLLLEVQQPSDSTFRIYDWDRVGLDGKKRPLHLDEALVCVDFNQKGPPPIQNQETSGPGFKMRAIAEGACIESCYLRVFTALDGKVVLKTAQGSYTLKRGDTFVAELKESWVKLLSGACVLIEELPL